ncbi:MAG: TetR/AcrR family transcriptional regulator [Myxococcota bacterium]|nr:TetR/AcrR family transcriptional regulator [Myxococcota bacterium]
METAQRLLSAAEQEFGSKGFDRARLADIANIAGISRPSLLYHYNSKDALYAAVVRQAFQRLGTTLVSALTAEGDFHSRIKRTIEIFGAFLEDHRHMSLMFLRELVDGRGPGRDLLIAAGVPILDRVEDFAKTEGYSFVRGRVPIRAALMQIISGMIVHSAAGNLRQPLWGDERDYSSVLARELIQGEQLCN